MKEVSFFDTNIIVRFLMNEASKEDIQLLEDWISSDAEHHSYFEQIRNTWNSIELENELDEKKFQSDLKSVMDRIEVKAEGDKIFKSKNRTLKGSWFYKAAAVFILGFAASWFVFQGPKSIKTGESVYNDIETPKGSSTIINLPDGRKIWLNAGSKLRYPQNFTKNERAVFLEGEAFFDVAKDKNRQFLVRTSDLIVKVFGTKFNVKSYPDENAVETTLVEGSISIQKNS
ncbi:MAG: FecR domain-containing protein, partial [Cyclobacteriaceae bacterium]|nr:FecR domain-containing protein [Cyclobacteriaceae bacterium]